MLIQLTTMEKKGQKKESLLSFKEILQKQLLTHFIIDRFQLLLSSSWTVCVSEGFHVDQFLLKLFPQYSRTSHIEVTEFSSDLSVMGCTWEACLVYSRVPSFHRHSDRVKYHHVPKHHTETPNINMCGVSGILLPMCLPIFSLGRLSSLGFFFCLCAAAFLLTSGKKNPAKTRDTKEISRT